jgi:LacI family transcriptional regulator
MRTIGKKTSLKDIAEKAGVSAPLVSFVLNGKGQEHRVSKEMTEKVLQIAKDLNYHPNNAARSLRTGKTKILGLIVADISNPFFAKLARGIENIAWEKGYQVIFANSDESTDKFSKLISLFIEKQVDGMIVVPTPDCGECIMQLVHRNIPVVMIDRHIEGIPVSSVQIDNVAAGYVLASFLLQKGYKRIGFMSYSLKLPNIKDRYVGYCQALRNHGLSAADEIVQSVEFENFDKNVPKALQKILSHPVDAIIFATNRVATQSLIALSKMKVVPRGLSLAGIDHPEFGWSDRPVHYIEQPIAEMGEKAIDLIFKQIQESKKQIVEKIILTSDWKAWLSAQEKNIHHHA